ncbi:MAG TPA: histidinol-phosphate transaminase [Woeseiaceae bacterium]|nr:histidinol-phosphate transaminase [Woeseiaceae bacterium]
MSIVNRARPEIRALRAYQAAEQVDDTIRLNANESPSTCSVGHFRRPLNRYPEVRPLALQAALANRFGSRTEQVLVTRGSSEAIDLITRAFCSAGQDNVVLPSPTFSMYAHYAEVQGAKIIQVPSGPELDFRVDINGVLAACTDATRVVFVCTPNNPTGATIPRADLLRLIEGRSSLSAVVVDEAYVEFGQEPSAVDLVESHPNLLVLRTLSKALGFAGARCGAVVGSPDVLALLSAIQAPYALSTPVIECVEDGLQAECLAAADRAIQDLIREREILLQAVAALPFVIKVWPSDANFFLVRVSNARRIMEHCSAHKVLLRHFGGELEDCIRISVGSRAENERLLQVLTTMDAS